MNNECMHCHRFTGCGREVHVLRIFLLRVLFILFFRKLCEYGVPGTDYYYDVLGRNVQYGKRDRAWRRQTKPTEVTLKGYSWEESSVRGQRGIERARVRSGVGTWGRADGTGGTGRGGRTKI